MASSPRSLTQWDDEEAHVAKPVRRLVRQLLHEEPQDGAEVMLCSRHSDLHRGWWLRIAVAAAIPRGWGREGQMPHCLWPRITLLSSRKPMPLKCRNYQIQDAPPKGVLSLGDGTLNVCLDLPGSENCAQDLCWDYCKWKQSARDGQMSFKITTGNQNTAVGSLWAAHLEPSRFSGSNIPCL